MLFKFPSADWNAATISVNESNAAASVLEITLFNLDSIEFSVAFALDTSEAKSLSKDNSELVALEISSASAWLFEST